MGCGTSKEALTAESGTESDYKATFEERKKLGEGEFGEVKLIVKKADPDAEPYAVKVLNKGFVFKDNTLYTPMKPEVLRMEIDILKTLNGEKYNLKIDSIFESSSKVYVVTELCSGGEMLEYTSTNFDKGLRTEDVSRVAYQLLSAVDHCAKHNILHRDIKPENVMFKANTKSAELRLIDFGCAIMDEEKEQEHETFAGTPFYISPEMFQKKYTTKTDVFSVGVLMYVLVAGYPAQALQAAFNLLHKAKRNLKSLPGMPEDMPESYYTMLDKMLTYRWKQRKSASELLDDEFVLFHQAISGEGLAKGKSRQSLIKRTKSIVLKGTGEAVAAAYGFMKFQRSVTTVIAAMLDRGDILALVSKAEHKDTNENKLGVITVKDLKAILDVMGKTDCVKAIEKQSNAQVYEDYSYEYTMLKPFTIKPPENGAVYNDADQSTKNVKVQKKSIALSSRNLNASARYASSRMKKPKLDKGRSSYIRGI